MNAVMAGGAMAIAALAAILPMAAFELPAPTGRYPVGTTSWHVTDTARRETFSAAGEPRQVEVLAWYPAAANRGSKPAPYLRGGLQEVRSFATLFGVPPTSFDDLADVKTHATLDAAPAAGGRKLPLLLFSHGYTGIPSAYTALLEDLASHGYAVLSVVHPYEASGATLDDGRVVTLLDAAGKLLPGIADVFSEWGPEDKTMAAVTSTTDPAEQMRLLRGYLAGLNHTHTALRRWVDDTKVVLARLSSMPANSAAGQLAAHLEVGRVGAFGHSMGGVTAGQFCVDEVRCAAGLNLDGIPQSGTMIDTPMSRPFLMVYSARPGRRGASDPIYQRAAHPYYRVDVANTLHLDFSDMGLWAGPLRQRPVLGTIDPVRANAITTEIVRQYFDQELLGRRSTLLAGKSTLPEVTVKTVPTAAR